MAGVAVAENPKKKARLTSAMARYSEKSIHDISRLLEGKEHKSQPSGAAKRRMREAIGPVCACYEQVNGTQQRSIAARCSMGVCQYQSAVALHGLVVPLLRDFLAVAGATAALHPQS